MAIKAQFPEEQVADGSFKRQEDAFRDWVRPTAARPIPPLPDAITSTFRSPVPGRTAPSSCAAQRLEDAIGMTVVDPIRDERGWRFATSAARSDQRLRVLERSLLRRPIPIIAGALPFRFSGTRRRKRIVTN